MVLCYLVIKIHYSDIFRADIFFQIFYPALLINIMYDLYVSGCTCVCFYVPHVCRSPQKPQEGSKSLKMGVTNGWGAGNQTHPGDQQKQYTLLTMEPSFQIPKYFQLQFIKLMEAKATATGVNSASSHAWLAHLYFITWLIQLFLSSSPPWSPYVVCGKWTLS